jgi:hypothetical protein
LTYKSISETHQGTKRKFLSLINFSDHWSFWQEQYPAVMVTDTAYLRNKNYHQQTDLPDTLNYQYMAQVIVGLKEAVSEFLNDAKPEGRK